MRTLDRYVLKEMFGPLLAALGGFVVLLVGHMLWTMVQAIVEKQAPLSTVVRLALFQVPWAVTWSLPASTLFACALAVNRLAGDGEFTALRTAGVPLARILAPIYAFGLAASVVCFAVDEFAVPWANTASENLARNVDLGKGAFRLATRRFLKATPTYLLYATEASEAGAHGILVFHTVPNEPPWIVLSDRATLENGVLRIDRPTTYVVTLTGPLVVAEADFIEVDVREAIAEYWSSQVGLQNMGLRDLSRELRRLRGQDERLLSRYRMQWHWALALPLACLVFAVLGGPMTLRFARGGSLTGALLALGVMCAYYLLKLWSDMLGNSGALPPIIAAWWQNALVGGIGVWLLLRER